MWDYIYDKLSDAAGIKFTNVDSVNIESLDLIFNEERTSNSINRRNCVV